MASLARELPHEQSAHAPVALVLATIAVERDEVKVVMPSSEEDVVNALSACGRARDDPHWADVWHGSVALAREITRRPELVRGKRVMDLGCGVGLAGIASALAGAREVVMSDREERALWCALSGCKANGIKDVREIPREWNSPDGIELPKVMTFDDVRDSGSSCVVSAAKVDWFEPEKAPSGFDVVLACDVLYNPDAVDAIATLALKLFEGTDGGGTFVLADPPGRFPKNHERFMALMEDPTRIPGYGGAERQAVVGVSSVVEECLNLEDEVMRVKLSNFSIVSR